ncbi:hypothetical protein [Natronolimnohabitans innermongolicus]|uniref:hypothetical protein n=1 Tax=Natronolimnohabitans innermongolicus TaxID=253107 RepID=UPI001268E2BE|nr:hypothetical protein [Natronolimnohabitans innermongolicus]
MADKRKSSRRDVIGLVPKVAAGSAILGTAATMSMSTASADRGPDPEDPHDDVVEEVLEGIDGSDFAEIHSAVTGPKRMDDQVGSVNVALAAPITYGDVAPGVMPRAENVTVTVEPDGTPGDYDLQNIVTHEQGDDGGEAAQVVDYALDAAWSASVGRVFPIPNPMSVEGTTGPDISQDFNETRIDADFGRVVEEDIIAIRWEVDFHVDASGTVPHGAWVWDVTLEGDVGNYSTGMTNPGFNKYDEFSHTHTVAISVQDYD